MAVDLTSREAFLTRQDLFVALDAAKTAMIEQYDRLNLRASGRWAESLEIRVEGIKGQILGEFYTEFMVFGRKPGGAPPVDVIYQWMLDKPTFRGPKTLGRAFAISKTIAQKGTVAFQQGGTPLLDIFDDPQVIAEFSERLKTSIQAIVQEKLIRTMKTTFNG